MSAETTTSKQERGCLPLLSMLRFEVREIKTESLLVIAGLKLINIVQKDNRLYAVSYVTKLTSLCESWSDLYP